MKILVPHEASSFFEKLTATYEVRLPVLLADGGRGLGRPGEGPLALVGGTLPAKPTSLFFPQSGIVFTASAGGVAESPAPERPLLVVGFTSRDLACLRFIDRFFADGRRDDLYFRLRESALIVGLSGFCGPGGTLLPIAGGGCDLELIRDGENWLAVAYSEAGEALALPLPEAAGHGQLERIREESASVADEEESLLLHAASLLRDDLVPDTFWAEIGDRCIACTGCNLSCPTCTCFGVEDFCYQDRVERRRMWDSCQLEGFMREASGHNPLGSEALRTRRRIHHKLAADYKRWGEISCFLCGRCDAACPSGIGMMAVVRQMVARFGGG